MGIEDQDIARVREQTDIVAVISRYTQLRRVGRRFSGLCPFHDEKSPSFSVNDELGLYYCFGCGQKGDAITFLREKEQLDFVGAVERLAEQANVTLHYTDANEGEDRKRRARLHDAVSAAVEYYHQRLLTSEDAGPARSYLRQRGLNGSQVRSYQIGWAPDSWDDLARSLRLPDKDLIDSGLGFVNRRGRQQDAFRGRVLFPIFDVNDKAIGFGGRILPGGDGPKYKNSAESAIYAKSRVLYGLNWAKSEIVQADEVVVCEGYTDVIGFAEVGMARAVATCGTALTEDHVRTLRRFARRVVLAFDADAAGQNAAARFYEWEKAHDVDVAVAALPQGVDPADLAKSDPDALRRAVQEARPFLEFRLNRLFDASELTTVEGRARAADTAASMVAEHPDPIVRDQYALSIAGQAKVDVDLVRARVSGASDRIAAGPQQTSRPARRVPLREDSPEFEALRLLLDDPAAMAPLLFAELFDDSLGGAVYELYAERGQVHEVIDAGGPEVAELVARLGVERTEAEPLDVAARLWDRYLNRLVGECRALARSTNDSSELAEISRSMAWYVSQRHALNDPDRQQSAVSELLAWVDRPMEET